MREFAAISSCAGRYTTLPTLHSVQLKGLLSSPHLGDEGEEGVQGLLGGDCCLPFVVILGPCLQDWQ